MPLRQAELVLEHLLRRESPARLLTFFQRMSEGLSAAFADSNRLFPAARNDRPHVSARGNARRYLLGQAVEEAATASGIEVLTRWTEPASWSYPVVRLGGFTITLGVVDRPRAHGPRKLRSRGRYLKSLARRNQALDPQGQLDSPTKEVSKVYPAGAFGALVVVEPSLTLPDVPQFIGFWVPSPCLKGSYYKCSLEVMIKQIRAVIEVSHTKQRKKITRKSVALKKSKPKE